MLSSTEKPRSAADARGNQPRHAAPIVGVVLGLSASVTSLEWKPTDAGQATAEGLAGDERHRVDRLPEIVQLEVQMRSRT
jgi:hypothetical protein